MNIDDKIYATILRFEGAVPHMYLDTLGYVTCGIGCMLKTAQQAQKIAFIDRASHMPATAREIAADYTSVKLYGPGKMAHAYHAVTNLDLTPGTIRELYDQKHAENQLSLIAMFPDYVTLPEGVRIALADMCWQFGARGLSKWAKLCGAVGRRDWSTAAHECISSAVRRERNETRSALFIGIAAHATV